MGNQSSCLVNCLRTAIHQTWIHFRVGIELVEVLVREWNTSQSGLTYEFGVLEKVIHNSHSVTVFYHIATHLIFRWYIHHAYKLSIVSLLF